MVHREFHFYYPRRVDVFTQKNSDTIIRKCNRDRRIWVEKWYAKGFYADCWGLADQYNGVYVFGKTSPKQLAETIEHEVVHMVITRIIGDYVSVLLDNIDDDCWL